MNAQPIQHGHRDNDEWVAWIFHYATPYVHWVHELDWSKWVEVHSEPVPHPTKHARTFHGKECDEGRYFYSPENGFRLVPPHCYGYYDWDAQALKNLRHQQKELIEKRKAEHPAAIKEAKRKYREANREKLRAYAAQRYLDQK